MRGRLSKGARRGQPGALHWAGYLLGFAFSGFFDGIVLHQILQWHHLLSLVEGVGGIGRQILFDGLFHAAMYLVAAAGLAMLWRSRRALAGYGAGRVVLADALIGFGAWNVLDGVLSHWVLAIHRIRLDAANPLLWDLGWFALFGLVPLALGLLWRRGPGADGGLGGPSTALAMALAVLLGGAWAAQPPPGTSGALVLFRPGYSDGEAFNAIRAAGGSPLWTSGGVWAVQWGEGRGTARPIPAGALLVSTSLPGGGCLAFSRV